MKLNLSVSLPKSDSVPCNTQAWLSKKHEKIVCSYTYTSSLEKTVYYSYPEYYQSHIIITHR